MSDADVARLVGAAVDRGRGHGYQPWPREPEEQPVYQVAWVALLPRPAGVDRGCMNGPPPWQRCLSRQLVPRRSTRDCCYYHSINWHQVSAAAIRIMRQARGEALAGEAFTNRAADLAGTEDLPSLESQALTELLDSGAGIQIERDDDGRRYYINGRHRTTAMLDVGVRRTIIIRWECQTPPKSATSRPARAFAAPTRVSLRGAGPRCAIPRPRRPGRAGGATRPPRPAGRLRPCQCTP
jgi:hypothetical protein